MPPPSVLGWVLMVTAITVCTFVIYHAFPEDAPRSTFTIDTVPELAPSQSAEAQNLG